MAIKDETMRKMEGATGRWWWKEGKQRRNAWKEGLWGIHCGNLGEGCLTVGTQGWNSSEQSMWQVTAPLMSLQKANAHFFRLKLCPRTAGPLCKAGCQLIDVSVASSITRISSSLPLCAKVTAFHPETADKCKTGNFFPLALVSNNALKNVAQLA